MNVNSKHSFLGMKGALKWCLAALFLSCHIHAEPIQFNLKGKAAILMNADTGAILYEYDSRSLYYPASTTKVATALYVLSREGEDLDRVVAAEQESLASISQETKRQSNHTLPPYRLEPDGMHIAIKPGEKLTLRELLEGMLIPSGNDAANVIAQAMAPSIPEFMERVNVYLKEIGCTQTLLLNPHGLHDPKHQTTAFDLAVIAAEALKNPIFCEIVSKTRYNRPKTDMHKGAVLLQTNRLLRPGQHHYSKAIGIKTGYHAKARSTLIAAARSEGRTLIAVLLSYGERGEMFQDAKKLFETAFNQPKIRRHYLQEGPQAFAMKLDKANRELQTYLAEPLSLEFYPAEDPEAKCFLYWHQLDLPIAKDQQVGELQLVSATGAVLNKLPLLAVEEVGFAWPHSWFAAFTSLHWLWKAVIVLIFVALIWKFLRR